MECRRPSISKTVHVSENKSGKRFVFVFGWVHNTGFYYGIGGVDVINNYYHRSNSTTMKLGAYRGAWGSSSFAQGTQNGIKTNQTHTILSSI